MSNNNMISFEKFKIGVDWMDSQHVELIDMTLDLISAIKSGAVERKIKGMFEFLDRYVFGHFSLEDELMKRYNYPGIEAHLAEHRSFILTLNNMKKELRTTGESVYLSGNVKRHLLDWMVNHIGETDKEFATFLLDKGIDEQPSQVQIKPPVSLDMKMSEEKKYC